MYNLSDMSNIPNPDSYLEGIEQELWKDDCANRVHFAEMFAKIIGGLGTEKSAVFLLDGKWGNGKTYFLRNFQQYLLNEGYRAIYFDAFAEDFSADPLVAICGQLQYVFPDNEHLKKILKDIIALVVKVPLLYLGVKERVMDDAIKVGEGDWSKVLDEYSASRASLEKIRQQLSSHIQENNDVPAVFIIDELDRCRPTFALELLERVKHIFEVPGIIFVFGANKRALLASVRSEYGEQDDEYLQKFFQWELKLPNAEPFYLAKRHFDESDYAKSFAITQLYYPLLRILDCSFRDVDISIKTLSLYLLLLGDSAKYVSKLEAVVSLMMLKLKKPNIYKKFAYDSGYGTTVVQEMSAVFGSWEDANPEHVGLSKRCRGFFDRSIYTLAEGSEKDSIREYQHGSMFNINEPSEWRWIKANLVERSEIVSILENLSQ